MRCLESEDKEKGTVSEAEVSVFTPNAKQEVVVPRADGAPRETKETDTGEVVSQCPVSRRLLSL
eukprot:CAMPEP_0194493240 /NCGR_PEP_ID=MMETSP0253-20130528/11519_1 /TAXON_ID=2966 /ORGANISM="Noctiluca scintillans" /LENGTH=63 /DNA_ID=CAMNT_0039334199 /DNA_START=333 /DNA_END=524 /DNA_ORIENTATION=+